MKKVICKEDKKLNSFYSILSCECYGDFTIFNNGLKCVDCEKIIQKSNQDEPLVFEEVYTAPRKANKGIPLKEIKCGNWRSLNYNITQSWVDHLPNIDFLIDLGSGPLTNFELLKEKNTIFIDGAKYDGIDIVCNFSNQLPFKANSVDAILCSNVFEHLSEPQKTFDEISRVLKTDGSVLILVPFLIKIHQEPFDFYRYTKHALKHLAQNSGLETIEIKEVGGFTNILESIFQIAIRETNHSIKRWFFKIQYKILRILRKLYGDDPPDSSLPQGYAMFLTKKNKTSD